MSSKVRRHGSVILQVIGACAVAFGVGVLLGLGWACIVAGVEAVVTGTLTEAPSRASTPPQAS